MIKLILQNEEILKFKTAEDAVEFIKSTDLFNYGLSSETETWAFFGGKCIYADTPEILKIGNSVFKKEK